MQLHFDNLRHLICITLSATILIVAVTPGAQGAISRTVNTTDSSGPGSLAQAITDTNANGGGTISFDIRGTGVRTINGALPHITQPVTIDGYSQPGSSVNTSATTSNAVLLIEIVGGNLTVKVGGCAIRGLIISGGSSGVLFDSSSSVTAPSVIAGNFIGTDASGMSAAAVPISSDGVSISSGNRPVIIIGGTAPADRNVIGGCTRDGVLIESSSNQILGNFIGVNATGNEPVPNGMAGGIAVAGADSTGAGSQAYDTKIGGTAPGSGNVISGNLGPGIRRTGVRDQPGMPPNVIQGNFIGTDSTGTMALPNRGGIEGFGFTVGGTTPAARNVISGNNNAALTLLASTIQGNYIGTDVTGTKAVGNAIGPIVRGGTLLGGTTTGAGNVVSGNGSGVRISSNSSSTANRGGSVVQGNLIGTDASGVVPLPNENYGIAVGGSSNQPFVNRATIGGESSGAGNVIAYNGGPGIVVLPIGTGDGISSAPMSTENTILSNSIFDNDGPGIDLNGDGVTPNDSGDGDGGPNSLQNHPVLSHVSVTEKNTTISGSLHTTASTAVLIQFFSSATRDASGFGEGQVLIGSTNVVTDSSGNALFDSEIAVHIPSGRFISATATVNLSGSINQTSEFSNAVLVSGSALGNISTRLSVQTGDDVLIGGFIVTGSEPKKLMLRAIGPSLQLEGKLQDPVLELYDGAGELIAVNDNWQEAPNAQEIVDSTIAPSHELESAILMTLPAEGSSYTALVRGANGGTGVGLAEGYDLGQGANSKLANISTRGLVQTGTDVMIGGFFILNGSQKVIVRAIGPSLPVEGNLADPELELFNSNGDPIASNQNWRDTQEAQILETTIPPSHDLEAAIVATLPPAFYTAIVRGTNQGTGVALVEVYALN